MTEKLLTGTLSLNTTNQPTQEGSVSLVLMWWATVAKLKSSKMYLFLIATIQNASVY